MTQKPKAFKLQNGLKATIYQVGCAETKIVLRECNNKHKVHLTAHTSLMLKIEIEDESVYLLYWRGYRKAVKQAATLVEGFRSALAESIGLQSVTLIYNHTARFILAKQYDPIINAIVNKVKPSIAPLVIPPNEEEPQ
jgi:hypothetical protein